MAQFKVHSVAEADKLIADSKNKGITVVSAPLQLPVNSYFTGTFDHVVETTKNKAGKDIETIKPEITVFDFRNKNGKPSRYLRADITMKETETQKVYESGLPYEIVRDLLADESNLLKEFQFKTEGKEANNKVYLQLMD